MRNSNTPERAAIWSGPLMALLTLIGAAVVGRFIPPFMDPADTAAVLAAKYVEHRDQVRIGAVLSVIGLSLIAPFGIVVATRLRQVEGPRPLLTYIQVTCVGVATVLVVLACTIWALTAYRPDEYPPELVRYSNDLAYFLFIFTYPPFTVWFIAIAAAILRDERPRPAFPRWAAYLNIWLAVLIMAGSGIAFFKSGPFAYNGLLALYVPVGAFFVWVITMTVLMLRNLDEPSVQ